jgi:hypothetical protein
VLLFAADPLKNDSNIELPPNIKKSRAFEYEQVNAPVTFRLVVLLLLTN